MTTATATKLVWVQVSRDLWRSRCGRFDVFASACAPGVFVYIDWEAGRTGRRHSLEAAQARCQERAKGEQA